MRPRIVREIRAGDTVNEVPSEAVAVWGLVLKPDADDTRNCRVQMEAVRASGGRTQAHDAQTLKKEGDRAYCIWEVDLSDAAP